MSALRDFSATYRGDQDLTETLSDYSKSNSPKKGTIIEDLAEELASPVNRHWQPPVKKPQSLKVIKENERVKEALLNYVLY